MFFNLLCRTLFLSTIDILNDKEIQKWISQIKEYQIKLQHNIFSQFQEAKDLIAFSSQIVDSIINDKKIDPTIPLKISHMISYYSEHIPSLLSDVELLVDRHGKPCKISRYTCAIFLAVPEVKFASVRSVFDSYFSSNNIEYQLFPIAEPTHVLPESGMWFFIKGGSVSIINQIFINCVYNKMDSLAIEYVKIYYNLSENLRLKVNNSCNAKQHFGALGLYSSCFREFKNQNSMIPVYWIIENSHANSALINELEENDASCFVVCERNVENFETTSSSSSTIITTRLKTTIEKFRKEYKNMSKTCEIFVSYSEDSLEHISKIERIVERLQKENFNVYFYKNAPLGTDMIAFMRKIETCDITLIIGTSSYREKAYDREESGVSFEDRILADVYMSQQREKIVPIAFGNFENSFPTPFNKLKGMSMTIPTEKELDTLVAGLINRYKINTNKKD